MFKYFLSIPLNILHIVAYSIVTYSTFSLLRFIQKFASKDLNFDVRRMSEIIDNNLCFVRCQRILHSIYLYQYEFI